MTLVWLRECLSVPFEWSAARVADWFNAFNGENVPIYGVALSVR